jgi:hypothetical protein
MRWKKSKKKLEGKNNRENLDYLLWMSNDFYRKWSDDPCCNFQTMPRIWHCLLWYFLWCQKDKAPQRWEHKAQSNEKTLSIREESSRNNYLLLAHPHRTQQRWH